MLGTVKDVFDLGGIGVFALREGGHPVDDPRMYYYFAKTIHLHTRGLVGEV